MQNVSTAAARNAMRTSNDEYRAVALKIIRERSFKTGTFKLASGKTSDFYLDMKPSMFHPEGVWAISNLLFDRLKDTSVQAIGGLEMGAVPLITTVALVSHLGGRPMPGFFVRKTVKDHGTKKLVEGVVNYSEIAGKTVAIIDDVTTTGQSSMLAVEAAETAGARVGMVISVVDRLEGAREFFERKNIEFACIFDRHDFMGS
jgi:orotate phosphoribosyltransferase